MSESGIVRDAETGEAVVAGTDITVIEILQAFANPSAVGAVLDAYPELTERAVSEAISFAAGAVGRDVRCSAEEASEHRSLEESIAVMEEECGRLRYELDIAEAIRTGLREIREGKVIPHEEAMAELRAALARSEG